MLKSHRFAFCTDGPVMLQISHISPLALSGSPSHFIFFLPLFSFSSFLPSFLFFLILFSHYLYIFSLSSCAYCGVSSTPWGTLQKGLTGPSMHLADEIEILGPRGRKRTSVREACRGPFSGSFAAEPIDAEFCMNP
jgi:polyferredoxin